MINFFIYILQFTIQGKYFSIFFLIFVIFYKKNMLSTNNSSSISSDLLYIHDSLKIKQKIKCLDTHQTLPLITFSDTENNIFIYDIVQKTPIRMFNMKYYYPDQLYIKDIKFFNCNDKKFITNYELTDIKKIKGIAFNQRNNIIIITFEKHIFFYSFMTQNIVKLININDLENKCPIKCEVFNYANMLILISDGNLVVWDLLNWQIFKVINKAFFFGKNITNFYVGVDSNEERFTIVSTAGGNLFAIDFLKNPVVKKGLEGDNRVNSYF